MSRPEKLHFPSASGQPEAEPPDKEQAAHRLLDEVDQALANASSQEDYEAITKNLTAIEQLYAPETALERELNLKEQYESQHATLKKVGILEPLSSGREGIKGIDDQEYPFPAYEEVSQRINRQEAILPAKAEQGFTRLLIVPYGMSLDTLLDKYKTTILEHHRAGQLLATKEKSTDPDEPLELNADEPLWVWDQYQEADKNGKLVYYPKAFDQDNHQGQTKQEVIAERGAWNVILIEDLPNIPREGQGQTRAGRAQLEANKTPREYLELLSQADGESAYHHEQGLTPEDHISYVITHLEETNQIIDDYQGRGSIAYNLGGYFPAAVYVPSAYWGRGHRRAVVGRHVPDNRGGYLGARSAVGA